MRHHFDHHLNVKDLILTYGSRHLVELGALEGHNTLQFLKLREEYPFHLVTISDGTIEMLLGKSGSLMVSEISNGCKVRAMTNSKSFPTAGLTFVLLTLNILASALPKSWMPFYQSSFRSVSWCSMIPTLFLNYGTLFWIS